jgi:O-antigen/teichoic acid export membrane protein
VSEAAGRVAKNTMFLYGKMAITMFISLYTTRLILNALGASDFGIFNIVGGAIAMLGFLNAAMAGATQRFMSYSEGAGDKEQQKQIFNISFIIHFGIAIVMGISLLIAGWFFFNGILNIAPERMYAAKVVYGSLIVSTIFTVMTVPYDAVLNAHENMLYYSIVGIVESIFKLGAALAVVYMDGDKLVLYGILMACIPLITISIMRIYCHRKYTECIIAPKRYWDKKLMKEMTGFAGWNLISTSVIMVSAYGQAIILNSFFGPILNAAQGIAGQVNGQLQVLSSNMLKALNPIIGKSAGANNADLLRKSTFFGAKYSTALYMLIAIPVFIQAPYILKLWLKELPEWTIVFVRFQLVKSFIEFQFGTIPGAIAATGRIKGYTIWSVIFNVLQLPVIYFLFKAGFPPYYMYIATIVFGNILVYAGALYFAKKHCKFLLLDYLRYVLYPVYIMLIAVFGGMSLISSLTSISSVFLLLLFISLSMLSFLVLMYYVGCSKEERLMIIGMKNKVLRFK